MLFKESRIKNVTFYGTIYDLNLPTDSYIKGKIIVDSLIAKDKKVFSLNKLLLKIYYQPKEIEYIKQLRPGDKVIIKGNFIGASVVRNPGDFDFKQFLAKEECAGMVSSDFSKMKFITQNDLDFKRILYTVRLSISNRIDELFNKEAGALVKGLLLADKSQIDEETKTAFINSGVVHVLAVSGLHVGMISLIFYIIFGRFSPITRGVATLIGMLFYILITGAPASVVRASIMVAVIITAKSSGRDTNGFNSLAVAAFLILLFRPYDLFSPGFQLSFAAVLSILAAIPLIQSSVLKINNPFLKWVTQLMFVSLAAQIGTLPLTIFYFGKISLVALFANLIVIPAIGVVVAVALLSLFIAIISISVASFPAEFLNLFVSLLNSFILWSGNLNISFIQIVDFSLYDVAISSALIILFYFLYKRLIYISAKIITAISLAICLILYTSFDDFELTPDGMLSLIMIDVGQGDAIFIKTPEGKTILIDAGNAGFGYDSGDRIVMPLLRRIGFNSVDYGFVSHMDADHFGGYYALMKNNFIKQLIKPHLDTTKSKDINFESAAAYNNIPIHYYSDTIYPFENIRLYGLVNTSKAPMIFFDSNNRGGVLKLSYGKIDFLLVGDAERESESYLVNRFKNFLNVEILKVGHHGSKTSSSEKFLNYVKPQMSLISCGVENRFNHPSPFIVDRLINFGSEVFRTDLEGALIFQTDGKNLFKVDWRNKTRKKIELNEI